MKSTTGIPQGMLTRVDASRYLREEWDLSYGPRTLATMAAMGGGPPFHRQAGRTYYPIEELDRWARSRRSPLLKTQEGGEQRPILKQQETTA
jgi:hypothetical protein